MPCYHPLKGYWSDTGGWTRNINRLGDTRENLTVPCGQCIGCRLEQSRQWAIRLSHENTLHQDSCFVTLTYSDEHVPYGESLDKTAFQKFAKRFRKNIGPFRYFHCGEYGETTNRPHYHAILFGWTPPDGKLYKSENDNRIYTSEILETTWGLGHCTFGEVTFESAAYCARYCTKKVNGDKAKDHYTFYQPDTGEIIHKQPEYATMSRRPGIGTGWLDKYGPDTFPKDEIIMRGKPMRPPRFYDKYHAVFDPDLWAETQLKRLKEREERFGPKPAFQLIENIHDPEETRRLHAGEVIARQKSIKREFRT